jgi:hypothetical protein
MSDQLAISLITIATLDIMVRNSDGDLEYLGAVFTEAGPVNVGRKRQHPSPRIDHRVSNLVSATCNWDLSKAPAQTMRMMMGLQLLLLQKRQGGSGKEKDDESTAVGKQRGP